MAAAVEARQHERLRVGLLELLDAALAQEVEHLLARGPAVQERREGGAVVRGDECEELGADVALVAVDSGRSRVAARSSRSKRRSRLAAQAEQLGVPLAVVGHVLEAAVVQLVEDPQGQLDVVVLE